MSKPKVNMPGQGAISDVDPKDVKTLLETVVKIITDWLK